MNTRTIESLEETVEYFLPDDETRERREKATVRRHEEIAEETAEAKRKKDIALQPPVREREDWTHDAELREIPVKQPVKKSVAHPLRKHTQENGVAGHGDYGIIHDPCPVHLTKHEQRTAGLWQEGIEWR
tara:strand:+ start:126 stop:515 length:390 start_codon:yes stop_codon:yes gene_type:complete